MDESVLLEPSLEMCGGKVPLQMDCSAAYTVAINDIRIIIFLIVDNGDDKEDFFYYFSLNLCMLVIVHW